MSSMVSLVKNGGKRSAPARKEAAPDKVDPREAAQRHTDETLAILVEIANDSNAPCGSRCRFHGHSRPWSRQAAADDRGRRNWRCHHGRDRDGRAALTIPPPPLPRTICPARRSLAVPVLSACPLPPATVSALPARRGSPVRTSSWRPAGRCPAGSHGCSRGSQEPIPPPRQQRLLSSSACPWSSISLPPVPPYIRLGMMLLASGLTTAERQRICQHCGAARPLGVGS